MLKISTNFGLDTISKIFLIISVLFVVGETIILFISRTQLPPLVPLLYSLPWGPGQLVSPNLLWILPGGSLIFLIVNFVVSYFLKQVVLTRILTSSSVLISILSFITLIKIIIIGVS